MNTKINLFSAVIKLMGQNIHLSKCEGTLGCQALPHVAYGNVTYSIPEGSAYPSGTTASLNCFVESTASDSDVLVCNDGSWNGTEKKADWECPTCKSITLYSLVHQSHSESANCQCFVSAECSDRQEQLLTDDLCIPGAKLKTGPRGGQHFVTRSSREIGLGSRSALKRLARGKYFEISGVVLFNICTKIQSCKAPLAKRLIPIKTERKTANNEHNITTQCIFSSHRNQIPVVVGA
jgi:hypothetical protein